MPDRTLLGWGRQPWSFVVALTDGLTCAWADYAGFHVGACPPDAPPYSHLWAWHDDAETLVRVRIDLDAAIVGALIVRPDAFPQAENPPVLVEKVPVVIETLLTWPPEHRRVGVQRDPHTLAGPVTAVRVLSAMPVTFIAGGIVTREVDR